MTNDEEFQPRSLAIKGAGASVEKVDGDRPSFTLVRPKHRASIVRKRWFPACRKSSGRFPDHAPSISGHGEKPRDPSPSALQYGTESLYRCSWQPAFETARNLGS